MKASDLSATEQSLLIRCGDTERKLDLLAAAAAKRHVRTALPTTTQEV